VRSQRERLKDILEAIAAIEEYAVRGRDVYDRDKLIRGWMVLHIERIGEAATHLPLKTRKQCPEIPWLDVIGMKNLLIHEYFGIDPEFVWMTAVEDLPLLKGCVSRILERLDESGTNLP
jgi:uncharacterized protein with HEPN domain